MPRVKKTEKYVQQVFVLFKKKGLNLSMEQIASELGLTKKTLYNNFENKEELFGAVVRYFYVMLEKRIQTEVEAEENSISQMLLIAKIASSEIKKLGDKFLTDVSKLGDKFPLLNHTERSSFYSVVIKQNLISGIKSGLYREDIPLDQVTLFFTCVIETFYQWNGEYKYLYEQEEYFSSHVKYHLYSVTNERGRKVLEELLQQDK